MKLSNKKNGKVQKHQIKNTNTGKYLKKTQIKILKYLNLDFFFVFYIF